MNVTLKNSAPPHISVCICTFKRPELLLRLLNELKSQVTDGLFTYSAVVIDNDQRQSAKQVVNSFKAVSPFVIEYYNEPEQNIALARNEAVDNAKGDFIVFIDDDEFPTSRWLSNLYKTFNLYQADGILGPVKPHFNQVPPRWLAAGKFCERPEYKTGTILHWNDTRTGNVLFPRNIFDDEKNRFDPKFGRTGGEDSEFFEAMIKQGRVFVWCNEAVVFEAVPEERCRRSFYIKRSLRIGGLTGEKARKWPDWYKYLAITTASLVAYSILLPFSILRGQYAFMKALTKVIYCSSWLLGFCGLVVLRYHN